MAYMNQEKKKKIAQCLKKVLGGYKLKYTLRVRHNHAITLTIREGELDFIGNWKETNQKTIEQEYLQVNQYWIDSHISGAVKDVLLKIDEAMRSADYYDRSDAMIDYFDTAYYYDIRIGEWCNPYKLIKA